tara:strand:- start:1463 stop:2860 length:1398 start_codon:yes stop_codon:yes gene_type:complete
MVLCFAPDQAESKVIASRFTLPGASPKKVNLFKSSNDFTVLLISDSGSAAQVAKLREHFSQYPMVMSHFLSLPQGGWEGTLTFNQHIKDASLTRTKGGLALTVMAKDERTILFSHIDNAPPRSVPSRYTGAQFRKAERFLESGNVRRATQLFIELGQDYALRSWASLRLADLDLMLENEVEACRSYNYLIEKESHRIAGVLAELRALAAGCDDKKTLDLDWAEVIKRISFADGPISDYLWGEYLWLVDFLARSHKEAMLFISLEDMKKEDPRIRLLPDALRQKLFSRAVYMAPTSFDVVRAYYRYKDVLKTHPDRKALGLDIARAMLDLDLLGETEQLLQPLLKETTGALGSSWERRKGLAQVMVLTAWTYQALGHPVMMDQMAKIYRKRFKKGLKMPTAVGATLGKFIFEKELQELRQGIKNLKRTIRKESRKSKSLIPKYEAAEAKAKADEAKAKSAQAGGLK